MGVDSKKMGAGGVDARDHQVGADVPLVAEEVLLEKCHAGYDARLAACGQRVQLELRGDQGRGEFRVGGGAGTGAPDVGGDEVELFAVLVGDDGTGGGAGIGCDLAGDRMLVGCWLGGNGKWWGGRRNEDVKVGEEGGRWMIARGRKSAIERGCTHHYTTVENASHNGCSCAGGLGQRDAAGV